MAQYRKKPIVIGHARPGGIEAYWTKGADTPPVWLVEAANMGVIRAEPTGEL